MNRRRRRQIVIIGTIVFAVVLGTAALIFAVSRFRRVQAAGDLPLASATRGEFLEIVRCRGNISAQRSVIVNAPQDVTNLQIVWLAPPGSQVKPGDVVIRFDPSAAQQQRQEKLADLNSAQANVDAAVAQAKITAEQDRLDLATSRYEVEKARLEASKMAIVSQIQGEESKVDLQTAQEKLRVQQAKVNLDQKSDDAKIASLQRQRDKAATELHRIDQQLAKIVLRAPLGGIVTYMMNWSRGWSNLQPFQVGDHVWPGASIAEIPEVSSMQMEGKLDEVDRGRIATHDDVRIHLDALPEVTFSGKLRMISLMTEQSFDGEWPPVRTFRAFGTIEQHDDRLRPGMNGSMDVVIRKLPDAISIPAKALFSISGKPVVYVADHEGYRAVQVEVLAKNPDEVAVRGINAGTMVTLVEPATSRAMPSRSAQPAGATGQ